MPVIMASRTWKWKQQIPPEWCISARLHVTRKQEFSCAILTHILSPHYHPKANFISNKNFESTARKQAQIFLHTSMDGVASCVKCWYQVFWKPVNLLESWNDATPPTSHFLLCIKIVLVFPRMGSIQPSSTGELHKTFQGWEQKLPFSLFKKIYSKSPN
jgi:hypothetical protein